MGNCISQIETVVDGFTNNDGKNKQQDGNATKEQPKSAASNEQPKAAASVQKGNVRKGKNAPAKGGSKPSNTPSSSGNTENPFKHADPSKFKLKELRTQGAFSYVSVGKQETVQGSIPAGIKKFKANPAKYVALTYQGSMMEDSNWPADQQQYTLYHRQGTEKLAPQGVDSNGWMVVLLLEYQHLPPFPNDELPTKYRDKYTDGMVHQGRKIHSSTNKPIMPGRGMGCGDNPLLKIIGDVDPSDVHQGQVGDCWLLSAISALAEFDGAVKKLFRKTKNLHKMPGSGPNVYTISLWDLSTWKEVDIVIDERLAAAPNSENGQLLASRPSEDGELWVCYLEKALACHCGGWDSITGGQCTHAWALMTGCKEQYTIKKNNKTGKYVCYARFDPASNQWAKHANSPKDPVNSNGAVWPVAWPSVGGGGSAGHEISQDELFLKMYAFDQVNYIVGAGTSGGNKKTGGAKADAGLVDNHAYTVIEAVHNAAGTGIDLFKVRNPWGSGEIEDGEFDDDGPGWEKYPQIKKLLNPVVADDGIFWVTKQEFFKFYDTIYVSASNMTDFLED